ncbi:hypothetical protein DFH11DRAFT_1600105 [Phellopilus nigrolimitatus]|nr:hypothetical protein DFH11DRAFT_1600105 [Phellopilus nigrolimitatus]
MESLPRRLRTRSSWTRHFVMQTRLLLLLIPALTRFRLLKMPRELCRLSPRLLWFLLKCIPLRLLRRPTRYLRL